MRIPEFLARVDMMDSRPRDSDEQREWQRFLRRKWGFGEDSKDAETVVTFLRLEKFMEMVYKELVLRPVEITRELQRIDVPDNSIADLFAPITQIVKFNEKFGIVRVQAEVDSSLMVLSQQKYSKGQNKAIIFYAINAFNGSRELGKAAIRAEVSKLRPETLATAINGQVERLRLMEAEGVFPPENVAEVLSAMARTANLAADQITQKLWRVNSDLEKVERALIGQRVIR